MERHLGVLPIPIISRLMRKPSKQLAAFGVDGIEMIAYNSDDLYGYYTDERCKELKKLIDSYGMQVSEFVLYAHAVVGLLDPDDTERQKSL